MASCEASLSDMPIVALANAGASLMPSPTIAVGVVALREEIISSFCSGLCSAITASIPSCDAI